MLAKVCEVDYQEVRKELGKKDETTKNSEEYYEPLKRSLGQVPCRDWSCSVDFH